MRSCGPLSTASSGPAAESSNQLGEPIADDWTVFDLVVFQGDLWAFGGEDRHLVVWRSRDCGQTWQRLHDRPAFSLGGKAIGLYTVRAVATADTLLVLGWQAGEWIHAQAVGLDPR